MVSTSTYYDYRSRRLTLTLMIILRRIRFESTLPAESVDRADIGYLGLGMYAYAGGIQ